MSADIMDGSASKQAQSLVSSERKNKRKRKISDSDTPEANDDPPTKDETAHQPLIDDEREKKRRKMEKKEKEKRREVVGAVEGAGEDVKKKKRKGDKPRDGVAIEVHSGEEEAEVDEKKEKKLKKKKKRREEASQDVDMEQNGAQADSATETHHREKRKERKKDKKRSGLVESQNTVAADSSKNVPIKGDGDDGLTPTNDNEKEHKKDRKKKDKSEKKKKRSKDKTVQDESLLELNPSADTTLSEQARKALEYAYTQFYDPSTWKFNKARQNWIVRNIWSEQIPEKFWPLALKYLQGVQGGAREALKKECSKIVNPTTEASIQPEPQPASVPANESGDKASPNAIADRSSSDASKVERATALIKALS